MINEKQLYDNNFVFTNKYMYIAFSNGIIDIVVKKRNDNYFQLVNAYDLQGTLIRVDISELEELIGVSNAVKKMDMGKKEVTTIFCQKCQTDKSIEEFQFDKRKVHQKNKGYCSPCKVCKYKQKSDVRKERRKLL